MSQEKLFFGYAMHAFMKNSLDMAAILLLTSSRVLPSCV